MVGNLVLIDLKYVQEVDNFDLDVRSVVSYVLMLSREFLVERGYCCGHGCLMCPYEPNNTQNTIMSDSYGSASELDKKDSFSLCS